VQRKQLVTGINAGIDERRGPGALYISAFVLPGKQPAEVEAAIYEEIDKLQKESVHDWEMQKIKNQNRAGYLSSIRSAQTRATLLSMYKVYYDDANLINTRLAKFNAVSKDDVQRVAKTYLVPARRTVMITSPAAASAPVQRTGEAK
jgi:zinc protease